MEKILRDLINQNKKTANSNLNAIQKKLLKHIEKLEDEAQAWKGKTKIQEKFDLLKGDVASLREQPQKDGEILEANKEAMREKLVHTIAKRENGSGTQRVG